MSTKQRREPYAKLFASWWCHQRTGPLSLVAAGLEARMLSWSAHQGSDGRIPRASVPQIAGGGSSRRDTERALAELIKAGVLEEDGDTLVIRHYLDANISKQRDEERRHSQNERQTRHRTASVTRDSGVTSEPVTRQSERDQSVTGSISLDHDHDHDHDTRSDERVSRARAPDPGQGQPTLVDTRRIETARRAVQAGYQTRRLSVPGRVATNAPSHDDACKLAGLGALPPDDLVATIDAFFGDEAMRAKGYPVGHLLTNPNQWGRASLDAARDDGHSRERPAVQEIPPWARTEVSHG